MVIHSTTVIRQQGKDTMYLSARNIFGNWDKNWDSYIKWVGLEFIDEIRTLDATLNIYPPDWGAIECTSESFGTASRFLPPIDPLRQYYQLAIELDKEEVPSWLTYARFLGYDLVDSSWTSSILNCGRWRGDLKEFTKRVNQYGLLSYLDAQQAKVTLPRVWRDDPHANVNVFALYDVTSVKLEPASALHASAQDISAAIAAAQSADSQAAASRSNDTGKQTEKGADS